MKKQVKLLPLILILVLLVALFSGCGSSEDDEETETEEETTEAAEEEVEEEEEVVEEVEEEEVEEEASIYPLAEETITFDYFVTFPTEYSSYFEDGWSDNLAYAAMEELTNVHIEFYQVAAGDSEEKYNLLIVGGDYTDFLGGSIDEYDDGVTIALNDLIDEYMPNYKEVLEIDESYALGAITDDGLFVGVTGFYTEGYPVPYGTVIRQDWLDELGMDVPVTYDDYYEVLTAFKVEMGASSPLFLAYNGVPAGNYLIAGYGVAGFSNANSTEVPFYQVDGEVLYGPIQDGYYDYLVMIKQWYDEGLISNDFATSGSYFMPEDDLVASDNCGIFYSLLARLSSWETLFDDDSDVNIQPIADAVQEEGDVNHLRHINTLIGSAIGISTQCEYPEIAAQWLDAWFSEYGYMLANYGIEDLTYTINDDGEIEYTEVITNNEDGLTFDMCLYKYCLYNGGIFLNNWERSALAYNDAQLTAIEVWNTSDFEYGFSSAITMTAEESDEFELAYADIKTYVAEMTLYFIVGERELNEETWEEYVNNVISMGIEDCVAIKQSAVDRYLARGMSLTY